MGVDFINNRLLGKIFRSILYIITSILVIIGIVYFTGCYIEKDISSLLSLNEEFILLTILILVLFISIVLIFLSIKYVFLSKGLEELSRSFFEFTETVNDIEDNLARCSRTTQELILDLISKFGVDSDEKES